MEGSEKNKPTKLVPSVPPPPAEVKVRTMRSDIEGIAKAGGGLPQFKTVAVEGMGLPRSRVGDGASSADVSQTAGQSPSKFPIWIIALIVVAFIAIAIFGWAVFLRK
jgi:hypothetical protein